LVAFWTGSRAPGARRRQASAARSPRMWRRGTPCGASRAPGCGLVRTGGPPGPGVRPTGCRVVVLGYARATRRGRHHEHRTRRAVPAARRRL